MDGPGADPHALLKRLVVLLNAVTPGATPERRNAGLAGEFRLIRVVQPRVEIPARKRIEEPLEVIRGPTRNGSEVFRAKTCGNDFHGEFLGSIAQKVVPKGLRSLWAS